jgi:hypothetical protein
MLADGREREIAHNRVRHMISEPQSVAAFLEGKRMVAAEVEGRTCYPDIHSVPGPIHGVMVVTHPSVSAEVARAAVERGIKHIWLHRSFGSGSVSPEALQVCRASGVEPIEGGCPLMYCQPVDPGHRFFRWWLRLRHRIPG